MKRVKYKRIMVYFMISINMVYTYLVDMTEHFQKPPKN